MVWKNPPRVEEEVLDVEDIQAIPVGFRSVRSMDALGSSFVAISVSGVRKLEGLGASSQQGGDSYSDGELAAARQELEGAELAPGIVIQFGQRSFTTNRQEHSFWMKTSSVPICDHPAEGRLVDRLG